MFGGEKRTLVAKFRGKRYDKPQGKAMGDGNGL